MKLNALFLYSFSHMLHVLPTMTSFRPLQTYSLVSMITPRSFKPLLVCHTIHVTQSNQLALQMYWPLASQSTTES